jgi:hypothetical protein
MVAYNTGGDLMWGFQETLDISRAGITGVQMTGSIPRFTKTTLAA